MTSELIGMGVLSIPRAFQALGMIPGIASVVLMAVLTTYTGILMHDTFRLHPTLRSYVDLLELLHGRAGRRFAIVTVYLLIFLICSSALVASAASWAEMFSHTCRSIWAPVATLLVYSLGQIQSMHKISWLSFVAFLMILLPIVS